ncbi:MAG: hypothetical protein VX346_22780 [Planctomycetota bacterium]|nr:hypothetical protein [Planctomycetota bacterium]
MQRTWSQGKFLVKFFYWKILARFNQVLSRPAIGREQNLHWLAGAHLRPPVRTGEQGIEGMARRAGDSNPQATASIIAASANGCIAGHNDRRYIFPRPFARIVSRGACNGLPDLSFPYRTVANDGLHSFRIYHGLDSSAHPPVLMPKSRL